MNTAKADPSKFQGEGMNFRAKLIGVEDVPEARGDKMCQQSMQKLKAIVKATAQHKQRIVVNVSLEGLKIIDGVSMAIQFVHAVHRISFIARDVSDSRAFGYIFGVGDGSHKFFAIKTERQAEQLVLTLRDLFQVVYEMKKQEVEDAKKQQEEAQKHEGEAPAAGEGTEEKKEGQENQEPVYQVPTNNTPVPGQEKPEGSNLLDLEDQLENIELGIQQMASFDNMFDSGTTSPDSTKSGNDPWGTGATEEKTAMPRNESSGSGLDDLAGLDDSFKNPNPFPSVNQGFGTTSSNPFGAPASQPFGSTPFGQPATTMGQPFGAAPAGGYRMPGTPMPPPQPHMGPGFGQPNFGHPAAGGFGQPTAAGFGQPVAGGFGQPAAFGQPGFGQQPAFPGAPRMPGVQPGFPPAFGAAPAFGVPQAGAPVQGQPNFFPDTEPDPNILAPTVLNVKEDEISKQPERKDAFADLVMIGGTDPRKSPKAMFTEINTAPKKSLNELKVDVIPPRSPSPGMPSPVVSPGFQASDPFGPLGQDSSRIPDLISSSEDPFDTSRLHAHLPTTQSSTSSPAQASSTASPATKSNKLTCDKSQKKTESAPTSKHKHLPLATPKALTNGDVPEFSDDFSLPSPEEPPPPLPTDAKLALPGGAPPPPPPRPKHEINISQNSTVRPRPVPRPRKSGPCESPLSLHNDPFQSIDPFSDSPALHDSSKSESSHKPRDPFYSSQSSFDSKSGDNWDPFSDFDSEVFKQNCFTVFDSSSEGNGSLAVSDQMQDPMYAAVNKSPQLQPDDSLI